MAKKGRITEEHVDKLYVIAIGFNLTDEIGKDLRFNPGTEAKPNFVEEKNFDAGVWKDLKQNSAVILFEKPEYEPQNIVAEIIEG